MTFSAGQVLTAQALNDAVPRYALKLANESVISSTTLQDDDELLLTVAASTTYQFRLWLIINSGTTPDWKAAWSVPAGAVMAYSVQEGAPSALSTVLQGPFTAATTMSIGTTGSDQIIIVEGVITTTSSGTMRLQWAQNTSNATNTTVKANSWLRLQKIS